MILCLVLTFECIHLISCLIDLHEFYLANIHKYSATRRLSLWVSHRALLTFRIVSGEIDVAMP